MGATSSSLEVAEGISRLTTTRVEEEDVDFWRALLTTPASQEDVFSAISPADVRKLAEKQPQNLKCLLRKIMFVLNKATSDVAVPGVVARGICEEQVSGFEGAAKTEEGVSEEALLQCMRILTRFMPFVHEIMAGQDDGEASSTFREFFWKPHPIEEASESEISFAEALVDVGVKLFFVPGFTVSRERAFAFAQAFSDAKGDSVESADSTDTRSQEEKSDSEGRSEESSGSNRIHPFLDGGIKELVWYSGVMVRRESGDGLVNARHNSNRVEVIKLLLALECATLYQSPSSFDTHANRWLAATTRVFSAQTAAA